MSRAEGKVRRIPLGIWRRDGVDHIVALFGTTPWVRDVRLGRRAALSRRGRVSPVRLEELSPSATAQFLTWFRDANPGPARRYLSGVATGPDNGLALAERHPVFRIVWTES